MTSKLKVVILLPELVVVAADDGVDGSDVSATLVLLIWAYAMCCIGNIIVIIVDTTSVVDIITSKPATITSLNYI